MIRIPQAKAQASILVREMQDAGIVLKHQQALEMVAKMSGHRDWNAMSQVSTVDAEQKTTASAGTLSSLTASLAKLQELATDVINSCDNTGCDGLTVTSEDSVEALTAFVEKMAEMQNISHPLLDFDPETQIAVTWSVDDVLSIRADLSDEQAMEVLQTAQRRHDADEGINWEVLRTHADWLSPEPENNDAEDGDSDD